MKKCGCFRAVATQELLSSAVTGGCVRTSRASTLLSSLVTPYSLRNANDAGGAWRFPVGLSWQGTAKLALDPELSPVASTTAPRPVSAIVDR